MDKNILRFHQIERPALVQDSVLLGGEEDEYLSLLRENTERLFHILDTTATNTVRTANLSDVVFAIDERSASDMIDQMAAGDLDSFHVLYRGQDKTGTSYLITINAIVDIPEEAYEYDDEYDDGANLHTYTGLYRLREGKAWTFNPEKDGALEEKWEEDSKEAEKFRILEEDEDKAYFLRCLADYMSVSAESLSGRFCMNMLRQNGRLISLYKMLNGLADYDFEDLGKPGQSVKFRAFLIPDDICRCGGAVFYDQGKYHVCQRLTLGDDEDACCTSNRFAEKYSDELWDYVYTPRYYFREVYKDSNAKNIQKCLMFCWDHYSPETMFNFPLSASAYAESRNPYSRLRVYTQYGKRDLNKPEAENLAAVKKFFKLKH